MARLKQISETELEQLAQSVVHDLSVAQDGLHLQRTPFQNPYIQLLWRQHYVDSKGTRDNVPVNHFRVANPAAFGLRSNIVIKFCEHFFNLSFVRQFNFRFDFKINGLCSHIAKRYHIQWQVA